MVETIFSYKPHSNESQLPKVAEALINAHPCLSQRGSHNPWYGWKVLLGTYRTVMAKSGCAEVAVNAGRRSRNNPDYDHPHSNIKKAGHSEINFLLNFPKGANQMSLEQMRLQVLEESEKPEKKKAVHRKVHADNFCFRTPRDCERRSTGKGSFDQMASTAD
ncbi:hypothetical protein ILYODFUR_032794 [Ilyodon furcidens]|uniref:Uncharacterized protein n=1 Tax=Ilyodon furcidens TaxID=33524 RepID=A0ABV0UKY9_9TELE